MRKALLPGSLEGLVQIGGLACAAKPGCPDYSAEITQCNTGLDILGQVRFPVRENGG